MDHKINISKVRKIAVIQTVFFDANRIKLESVTSMGQRRNHERN